MTRPDRDVLLCRDCCCGDPGKHPATDHAAQRSALEAAARVGSATQVRVRVVDCLSACERSNVVLVRDFTAGRRPRDTWLGDVLDEDTTDRVICWVGEGGPLPADLVEHRFEPDRPGR